MEQDLEQEYLSPKELKKLRKIDLLELLLAEREENEALRTKIKRLEAFVDSNGITPENLGTLAEASLRLSGIFADADKAARLYLENLRRITEEGGSFRDEERVKSTAPAKTIRRRSAPVSGR